VFDEQIAQCRGCSLGDGLTWCPGEGPNELMTPFVVGMNPGVDEARDKRPFVGASSRIRELLPEVYYTNVVKCSGRVSRCATCRWIALEVNTIKPLKLVLLGGEACKRMTGRPFKPGVYSVPTLYGVVQAFVTWHPSPANNYNWKRLQHAAVEITTWLKS